MRIAPSNTSALLKFASGNLKSTKSEIINSIHLEQQAHSDLLFLEDCIDADDALVLMSSWHLDAGPSSTTCKVTRSIAWAVQTYHFQYFFRLGDDSYLRVDKFLYMLVQSQLPSGKAVIGQIMQAEILGMFQQYAQGMGYALTAPV